MAMVLQAWTYGRLCMVLVTVIVS